jgi:Domain of unknown function (DUF5667)
MSTLLPANRRAERFAALVDATSSTGADEPYAPLLEVVGTLRAAAEEGPAPRADYVADLRSRLMAEADTALVPTDARLVLPQRHPTTRKHGRFTAAVAGLVLVGSGAGLAVAAQSSAPGDGLYPLKRGLEHVGERLSLSEAGRGRDLLDQATARLGEVDTLLERDATDAQVAATLRSFTSSAGGGADDLFRAYQRNGDDDDIATVRDFADTKMGVLTDLSAKAPSSLRSDFAEAAQLLSDLDQQATTLCGDCGPRGSLDLPARLRPVSHESALVDLLAAAPRDTSSTRATGAGSATSAAGDATSGAPVSTADRSAITPPRLGDLQGADAPGSTGGTATSDGNGPNPSPRPLDETLPTPSAPATGLPKVDDVTARVEKQDVTDPVEKQDVTDPVKKQDVTDPVKKQLGSVTDPLTP